MENNHSIGKYLRNILPFINIPFKNKNNYSIQNIVHILQLCYVKVIKICRYIITSLISIIVHFSIKWSRISSFETMPH